MAGRYYPQKDIDTFDKFNKELVGDLNSGKDGVINTGLINLFYLSKKHLYPTQVGSEVRHFSEMSNVCWHFHTKGFY